MQTPTLPQAGSDLLVAIQAAKGRRAGRDRVTARASPRSVELMMSLGKGSRGNLGACRSSDQGHKDGHGRCNQQPFRPYREPQHKSNEADFAARGLANCRANQARPESSAAKSRYFDARVRASGCSPGGENREERYSGGDPVEAAFSKQQSAFSFSQPDAKLRT